MNRFIALTAAAVTAVSAVAGVASAQTYSTGDAARAALSRIAPEANVSALSNAEAVAAYQVIQTEAGAGNTKAAAEALIRSYQ